MTSHDIQLPMACGQLNSNPNLFCRTLVGALTLRNTKFMTLLVLHYRLRFITKAIDHPSLSDLRMMILHQNIGNVLQPLKFVSDGNFVAKIVQCALCLSVQDGVCLGAIYRQQPLPLLQSLTNIGKMAHKGLTSCVFVVEVIRKGFEVKEGCYHTLDLSLSAGKGWPNL